MSSPMLSTTHQPLANPDSIVQEGEWRLTVLTAGLVRLEHSPTGEFEDKASTFAIKRNLPTPDFKAIKTEAGGLSLTTANMILTYDGKAFTTHGLQVFGVAMRIGESGCGGSAEWRYGLPDEFGRNMGGTARTLDVIGKITNGQITKGKIDVGEGIISREGISMIDDSKSMLFTDDGWFTTRQPGRSDIYIFCYGRDHRAALAAFYAVSGPPPVLPRWSLGNWWSKYCRSLMLGLYRKADFVDPYKQDEYMALMDKFQEEKIPLAVAVVDMDWHILDIPANQGAPWTGYTWNKELLPDHVKFMADLHDRDLKVTLNTHPGDGIRSFEESYERMCKKLNRDPSVGDAILFDPTDRKFLEAYFTEVHHPLEDEGVDFWWIDWQQGNFTRTEGIDPMWMLNHYHFMDSKRRLERRMTFSRFAGPGNQRYPVGFSGDTEILWSTLSFQPEFTATSANIGFGWWSHDIGGHHHGITDDELMIRWIQLGLFSPILRLHSNWNQSIVREPWLRGPECRKIMTEVLQLRHKMIPYLYTMSVRATSEGRSLVEPMYYDHPTEDYAYRNKNEFLFGSEMIVAPITQKKVFCTDMGSVECWLPHGRYVDLFTGTTYDGDRVIVMHRTADSIPVLSGAGSIIPLDNSPEVSTANGAPIPSALEIIVTVGVDAEFTIVEDDGTGEDVDHIKFCRTPIKYIQKSGQIIIGPTNDPLVQARDWTIQLPAFPLDHIGKIKVKAGKSAADFEVKQDNKSVIIHIKNPVSTNDQVTIELGTDLRMRDNDLLSKVDQFLKRAQIEHDIKFEVLTIIKANLTRAVLVSRIEATKMDPEVQSALLEFILANA